MGAAQSTDQKSEIPRRPGTWNKDAFTAMRDGWLCLRNADNAIAYLRQSVVIRYRSVLRHRAVVGTNLQEALPDTPSAKHPRWQLTGRQRCSRHRCRCLYSPHGPAAPPLETPLTICKPPPMEPGPEHEAVGLPRAKQLMRPMKRKPGAVSLTATVTAATAVISDLRQP